MDTNQLEEWIILMLKSPPSDTDGREDVFVTERASVLRRLGPQWCIPLQKLIFTEN